MSEEVNIRKLANTMVTRKTGQRLKEICERYDRNMELPFFPSETPQENLRA